jgi:hypothetical protein
MSFLMLEDGSGAYELEDDSGGILLETGSAALTYAETILADSPVAYWRLGESAGTTADNAEGTAALDGTYSGSPTLGATGLLTGDSDTAVTFGTSKYVSVAHDAALNFSDVFSLEFWVKVPSLSAWMSVIAKGGATGWQVGVSVNRQVVVYLQNTINVRGGSVGTLQDGTTYHVVVTKNGGNYATVYINGSDASATATAKTAGDTTGSLYLATYTGSSEWLSGTLDEVAVYDYALTSTQVTAHYDAGTGA